MNKKLYQINPLHLFYTEDKSVIELKIILQIFSPAPPSSSQS